MKKLSALLVSGVLLSGAALAQQVTRVSVDSNGVEGNRDSATPSISADGRFVAFESFATNLVPGDTNLQRDIFVHDRVSGVTSRVSVDSAGVQAIFSSAEASISADGRFVAFWSNANNLVPGDTNNAPDIFVHDRATGVTSRVSVNSAGVEGNNYSDAPPSISADGQFVAFWSFASNLVPGDTNNFSDIFVHDRATAVTSCVSSDPNGLPGNGFVSFPTISADGRFVAFGSDANRLVPGDSNLRRDVFVHDRASGVTSRVSVDSNGVQGNQNSSVAKISADGRFVAFYSVATNLFPDDNNGTSDIFGHDRATGVTSCASVNSDGVLGNGSSESPWISPDGRFVAFSSVSSNLVPDPTRQVRDGFVHDQVTGVTSRVSGVQGESGSIARSFSADNRYIAFWSLAGDLVPGDRQGWMDVFVREHLDPNSCRAGTVNANAGPVADVLLVNASAGDANRIVSVAQRDPIEIAVLFSPSGPAQARYVFWIWVFSPANALEVAAQGQVLGCTVNPSPFRRPAGPQPFRCLHGTGVPAAVCGSVRTLPSPARAPWTLNRPGGFTRPGVFTLQGILEDAGAGNTTGFSVTNAVILRVQ